MDVDMDIDHPFPSTDLSLHHSAPVAGPSTLPTPPPPPRPTLFLLPPAPAAPPPLLRGSEDVLGRFRLHEAYDKFVRPFFGPDPTDRSTNHPPHPDKGKGKERDGGEGGGEVEEEEVEKDWRRQNTYKYLIKGLPGSHSTKKDQFLSDKVNAPPKQHIDVVPFEFPLEKNPFIVDGLGIPGWGGRFDEESKEERRRRKEAKKLAKAQALGITPINTSFPALTPTPATGTPTAAATPQPHSAARARGGTPQAATPTSVTAAAAAAPRGVKREHEDSAARPATPSGRPTHANGSMPPIANGALPARPAQPVTNGNAMYGTTPPMTNGTGAGGGRAGVEGARPRPKKKQRLDLQGQARDMLAVPAQQPTPQGV